MFNQWQKIIAVILGIIIIVGILLIGRTVGTQIREKIITGNRVTPTPAGLLDESVNLTPEPQISPQIILQTTLTPSPKLPNPAESNSVIKTTPKTGAESILLSVILFGAAAGFLLKKKGNLFNF